MAKSYQNIITLETGKRGGKPCIKGLRITVYDVLSWLADGMTSSEIIEDFPELKAEDISACLSFAADREHGLVSLKTLRDHTVEIEHALLISDHACIEIL